MSLNASKKTIWKQELFLAAIIFLLAAALGLTQHWTLVGVSLRGELLSYLDRLRTERRAAQFKAIKTVNLEQAHVLWQAGKTLVLDARHTSDYQELRVSGAINLPPEDWPTLQDLPKLARIDKERQILVYCSQESCDDALKLAEKLQALGFTRVLAFTGGFRAWDEAGYPVDTGS
jgi:rhodanese-related sulfurtransferase